MEPIPSGAAGYHALLAEIAALNPSAGLSPGLVGPQTLAALEARRQAIVAGGPPAADTGETPTNKALYQLVQDYRRAVFMDPQNTPEGNSYFAQLNRARSLWEKTADEELGKRVDQAQHLMDNPRESANLLWCGEAMDMLDALGRAVSRLGGGNESVHTPKKAPVGENRESAATPADAHRIAQTQTRLKNAYKLLNVAQNALSAPCGYPTGYVPYPAEAVAEFADVLASVRVANTATVGELRVIEDGLKAARARLDKTWQVPLRETRKLIDRIAGPGYGDRFDVELIDSVQGTDVFELDQAGERPVLRGNNAVALATAFNYYLKYVACQEFPYIGAYHIRLPLSLPAVPAPVHEVFLNAYRHYFNEVDFRYTAFLYDLDMCQRRFDWLAMNGYNIFQMGFGEKNVWHHAKAALGFDAAAVAELRNASNGNSQYFGTYDVSEKGFAREGVIAQAVADMAFKLGLKMEVLPFTGQVPFAFPNNHDDYYVGANPPNRFVLDLPGSRFHGVIAYPSTRWMNLPQGLFISADVGPDDAPQAALMRDRFYEISTIYWEALQDFYGYDRWGLVPELTFRSMVAEQGFVVNGPAFSHGTLTLIQEEMFKINPDMVWVQDAWRYVSWLSKAIDLDRSLLLEYKAYNRPMWDVLEHDGVPWAWCLLWNFGGNTGMDCGLGRMVYDVSQARKRAACMRGLAAVPEGSDTNPVLYDLFSEMAWRNVDVSDLSSANAWVLDWLKQYARRRYGAAVYDAAKVEVDAMWEALNRVVFRDFGKGDDPAQTLVCAQPAVYSNRVKARYWADYEGAHPVSPYRREDIQEVWEKALLAAEKAGRLNPQFLYDLTDITRQALGDLSEPIYAKGIAHYYAASNRDKAKMLAALDKMVDLCRDMDQILATTPEFLLGNRIAAVKKRGFTPQEIYYHERLERTYLTYWILEEGVRLTGDRDAYDAALNNLFDYCNRHLAGLMTDYYGLRWQTLRDYMASHWDGATELDGHPYEAAIKQAVKAWVEGEGGLYPQVYTTQATGCALGVSRALYQKYYVEGAGHAKQAE